LDGDALQRQFETAGHAVRYTPVPKFPAVTRDLAPVFDKSVPYAAIERLTTEAAGPLLEHLSLTDVYEGANLGANRRSLTLRLSFRSPERTLTDAEVEGALETVRARLREDLGADLRG
jgi:phenylalanyl-tRNA synthetase beta chain